MTGLNVKQQARYDARQTPAQPTGDTLSPLENKLEERFHHRMATLCLRRERALRSERVSVIANDLTTGVNSFDDLVRASVNEIWAARLRFDPFWREARAEIRRRLEDLKHFKRENLLTRDALYPSLWLGSGVLALAFVIETLANAGLFAQVSSWGYTGGALYSMALSLPNLALGFAAGFWGLRGRHHIRPPVRWIATGLLLLTVTAAAFWNFYVGHLRAYAGSHANSRHQLVPSDWHQITGQMLSDPASVFVSPQAVILMVIGAMVFTIAVHDGLDGFADRYPGFAAVDRRVRNAIQDAEILKWQFFGELSRLTQRGIHCIDQRLKSIHAKARVALRILDSARIVNARFARRAADYFWVHREVVRAYQSINRTCRGEEDIPRRFDAPLASEALLPAHDWQAMRDRIRAATVAAAAAAEAAAVSMNDHRLRTMSDIDRETTNLTGDRTLLPPPTSRPEQEAA